MSGVKKAISNRTLASLKQLNHSMMRTADFTTGVPVFLVSILAAVISELFDTSDRNGMLWTKDYVSPSYASIMITKAKSSHTAYMTQDDVRDVIRRYLHRKMAPWTSSMHEIMRLIKGQVFWKSICSFTMNDSGLSSVPVRYFTLERRETTPSNSHRPVCPMNSIVIHLWPDHCLFNIYTAVIDANYV